MKRLTKLTDQLLAPNEVKETESETNKTHSKFDDITKIKYPIMSYHLGNNSYNKSNFRYTLDTQTVLTLEQRSFYEENGYIIIPKLLNKTECKYFYDRFTELALNPEKRKNQFQIVRDIALKNNKTYEKNDPNTITKMQGWINDEKLWKYGTHENIVKYAKAFCGDNMRGMVQMLINKPADLGTLSTRHPFHQDQWYFPFGPADHIVCSWTALQRIGRHNGGLSVVPTTHRSTPKFPYCGQVLYHNYPSEITGWNGLVNFKYYGIQLESKKIRQLLRHRVHLEMNPGDTVFFHPLLLHASGTNLSNSNRRSISVHYASTTMCKYESFKENNQDNLVLNVKGLQRHHVYALSSKHVCGKKGNLTREVAYKIKF